MYCRGIIFCLFFSITSIAQSLGGNAVFNFLQQPNTSQLAALGGINISNISNDVGLTFNNPALLRRKMHQQLDVSFNSFLAGVKNYSLTTAHFFDKQNITAAFGVNYFSYGTNTQTDAAGNILGSFKANDYVLQFSASKQYKDNWFLGATIKYLNSNYGSYKSNGLAADIALAFADSVHFFQAAFVIKNLGTQLEKYQGTNTSEELPFDVQFGITKKLEKAPIQFSLTAHHLQQFDILYNDTLFKASEGDDSFNKKNHTLEKVFAHLVFAAQFFIDNKIEVTTGYNFLRRHDLNVYNTSSGLNGFNMGFGLLLKKFHFRYSTGFYQQNMFHQIGLNLSWANDLK
jgi:hypothetical protein